MLKNLFNANKNRFERMEKEVIDNMATTHTVNVEINAATAPEVKEAPPAEEWIWVNGFKGTDKNMRCRDQQYEMHTCYDISDDRPVEECCHGFHLCRDLSDVYNYYPIGNENRFFEVKALVRKTDYDNYGAGSARNYRGRSYGRRNKLVAKSIIFIRELNAAEILECLNLGDAWTEDDKLRAIKDNLGVAYVGIKIRTLVNAGYSETFSRLIATDGNEKLYDTAVAVGSQDGLSMDMKVWAIFSNH